jgi:small subunit ribosomal protein S10
LGLKHNPDELPYKRELDPNDTTITEEAYASTLVHGRAVQEPHYHPRTHSIPVANLHFRSHHIRLLNLFTHFAVHAASSLGIPASKVVSLPTKRRLWTVLRSPFVHKKSQENFERKTHKRAIKAWDADPEVVHRWITYLRANAMPGVGLKVTTWERLPLDGTASTTNDNLITAQNIATQAPQKIKALGKKILVEEASGRKA